jgi:hypothetical protein
MAFSLSKLLKLGKSMSGDVGPEQLKTLFEGMGLEADFKPLPTANGPSVDELQREIAEGMKRGGKFFTVRVRSTETGGSMTALLMAMEPQQPANKKVLTP